MTEQQVFVSDSKPTMDAARWAHYLACSQPPGSCFKCREAAAVVKAARRDAHPPCERTHKGFVCGLDLGHKGMCFDTTEGESWAG
jgi:hypothetical protein